MSILKHMLSIIYLTLAWVVRNYTDVILIHFITITLIENVYSCKWLIVHSQIKHYKLILCWKYNQPQTSNRMQMIPWNGLIQSKARFCTNSKQYYRCYLRNSLRWFPSSRYFLNLDFQSSEVSHINYLGISKSYSIKSQSI